METVKIEVEVPKETQEFCNGLTSFIDKLMQEIKDNGGWAMGDDLPGVAMAAIAFMPALNGVMSLSAEAKEHTEGFTAALAITVGKIVASILAK